MRKYARASKNCIGAAGNFLNMFKIKLFHSYLINHSNPSLYVVSEIEFACELALKVENLTRLHYFYHILEVNKI